MYHKNITIFFLPFFRYFEFPFSLAFLYFDRSALPTCTCPLLCGSGRGVCYFSMCTQLSVVNWIQRNLVQFKQASNYLSLCTMERSFTAANVCFYSDSAFFSRDIGADSFLCAPFVHFQFFCVKRKRAQLKRLCFLMCSRNALVRFRFKNMSENFTLFSRRVPAIFAFLFHPMLLFIIDDFFPALGWVSPVHIFMLRYTVTPFVGKKYERQLLCS